MGRIRRRQHDPSLIPDPLSCGPLVGPGGPGGVGGLGGDGGDGGDATVSGGFDIIHGGNGDDIIYGDGFAEAGTGGSGGLKGDAGLSGPIGGAAGTPGAQDGASGVAGLVTVIGGRDQLFGDAGNDTLYGQGGDDYLCGGVDAKDAGDKLWGGSGVDLACAHDDAATVDAGVATAFDLRANDEQLDDEGLGEDPDANALFYALVGGLPAGITGTLDSSTGVLTYTATQSGTVRYSVTRAGNPFVSMADFLITVLLGPPPVEPVEPTGHHHKRKHHHKHHGDGDDDDSDASAFRTVTYSGGLPPGAADDASGSPDEDQASEADDAAAAPAPKAPHTDASKPLGLTTEIGVGALALALIATIIAALRRRGSADS